MFHAINDAYWFIKIIESLQRFYNIIPIKEVDAYYNDNTSLKSCCVISFDDGDKSFYENVYPILKRLRIPAVLYVSPSRILERKNFWFQEIRGYDSNKLNEVIADYLSLNYYLLRDFSNTAILKCLQVNQIEEIVSIYRKKTNDIIKNCILVTHKDLIEMHKSEFVTIGAHTQNHPILANEDDHSSEYEISSSIEELSDLISSEVKYFAYPNGIRNMDYSEREINILNKNGISLTVSTNIGHFNKADNKQEVPRIGISYGSDLHILSKIILGKQWGKIKRIDNENHQRLKVYEILKDLGKL